MTQRQCRTRAIQVLELVKVGEPYTETEVLIMMATLTTVFCLGEVSGLQKAGEIVRATT